MANAHERDLGAGARVVWTDYLARLLRTNKVLVAIYNWLAKRAVPMLFALFVAAPIGLLIVPFFIPKFVRNAIRRRRYGVRLSPSTIARTPRHDLGPSHDRE